MQRRLKRSLLFVGAALAAAFALALAIAPLARPLIDQWSRADVESRSRLVFNAVKDQLKRAMADRDYERLAGIFESVALDQRILAVGLCDSTGLLIKPTRLMPATFSCDKVARSDAASFSIISSDGLRIMVSAFPVTERTQKSYFVILHDLSFIGARSGEAQTRLAALLAVVAAIMIAAAGVGFALAFRSWMNSLRRAVQEIHPGSTAMDPRRDLASIDEEIKRLLRALEAGRVTIGSAEIDWSPASLQRLLVELMPEAEVLILSNREPYIHNRIDGTDTVEVQIPASGLVSALEPVIRACGGTWIAHGSGSADREAVDAHDRLDVPPGDPAYVLRRVWIDDDEQDGFYYGFSNEGMWPLCHIAFVRPQFRDEDWRSYRLINERFADAVIEEAKTEDPVVLVQDYHFALAPRLIRQRLPKATIISFWHIPWPNAETFSICPWKEEIIEGLLGSTIIGFHTQFHCNNFFETVDRFVESRIDREHATVTVQGHETMVRAYPISIEWPPKALDGLAPVETCRAEVRHSLGLPPDTKLIVGIERFDYTKGILDRMRALDDLLTREPQWKHRLVFVQVAAPTRSRLDSYSALQAEAIALTDQINARHGEGDYKPIHLIVRHHGPADVFRLFRAADICIVSSLHDGMNLVAKEFVAPREDERGVLILSSFTGASRELSEALIVNPYNTREMSEALGAGLRMPDHEQAVRMSSMRRQVRESNVYRWAGRMLIDGATTRRRQRILDISGAR
ncbi:trehalose-6-phosphate synthase [Rhodopseudomonas sp. B29]|uniref:alpha,alpha-trehalose-phosphate synthase (UDP-forming) n=1 Tax=Rhodopseudomonas sp. B29 TaxID=95607 RepID=UPI00034650AE|nr:trehalose-6-phosphate synthase [Rhodopseudomonas sp. B29]